MKKLLFLSLFIMFIGQTQAQIGINTVSPQATLDVVGKPSSLTEVDGVIAPRLSGNQLKAKDALYSSAQTGAIVYITSAASPTTAKTINVDSSGYYFFDGNVWVKLSDNKPITADNGLTKTADNIQLGGTLLKNTDIATAGFNTTFSGTGKVGIGTSSPTNILTVSKSGVTSGIATSFVDGITLTSNVSNTGLAGPGFYFEGSDATVGQKLLKVNYTKNTAGNSLLNFQAVADNASSSTRQIMSVYHNGNVGIADNPNTIPASEKLDVASGNVRIRDINSNTGDRSTDKIVVADANGVLKTIPKQPAVLFGGNLADAVTTGVNVSEAAGSQASISETLRTITFTIDYTSVVTFDYSISYNINNADTFSDGRLRRITSFFRFTSVPTASSLPINVVFASQGYPFSSSSNTGNIPGFYYLSASQSLRLTPGTYTVVLYGNVRNTASSTVPLTVTFGGSATDFINITAQPIE